MAKYECVVLGRQDLSNTQAEQLSKHFEGVISENSGSLNKTEYWGLRPLAYRIKKNRKAHYLYFETELAQDGVKEFDRLLGLNEDVLRHLIVRKEAFEEGPTAMNPARAREEERAPRANDN